MSHTKYHFYLEKGNACGRAGRVITDRVNYVTCLNCKATPEFKEAKADLDAQREAAFQAQEPRQVGEPWQNGLIVCRVDGTDLFRYRGRSCYGHYDDWVCAECGTVASRLTETGMCF